MYQDKLFSPLPAELAEEIPAFPIYRLSVAQYHAMIETGILGDDPCELLEGWLIARVRKTRGHTYATHMLRDFIEGVLPSGWDTEIHGALTTSDSEPEPDLEIIRGSVYDYRDQHPMPPNIAIVIEIADLTLHRDRTLKLRIYAAAGIPCYWLLNLIDRQLEVYTAPTGEGSSAAYTQRTDYPADAAAPLLLDGAEIAHIRIADLLP